MLAVALAVVLAAVDPTPSEVHLAYGDEFSSVTVSWATVTPSQSPHVTYGTDTCSGDTVNAQVMAMNTSADRMTYLYNAVITGLSPDTEYRYCVAGEGVALPPVSIRTRSVEARSTKVIFFGDTGNNEHWTNGTVPSVAARVRNGGADVVLHTGDMAYYAKDKDGLQGDIHAEELSLLSGGGAVPLMVVPGNGEVFCYRPPGIPAWAACMKDYQMRFIMPGWKDTHSLWSSFDLGYAHYLLLDSEAHLWCGASQNNTLQRMFMEEDLAAAQKNRDTVPWLVVVIHRPFYSSCNSTGEQESMREGFYDILEKYNVDLVLNGHVHSYERTFPVTGNYTMTSNATVDPQPVDKYTNPKYPVHVVSGAAGNGESIDDFGPYDWSFSAFRSLDIGYNSMTVHNKTHVSIDFFSVTQSKVIDAFVIEKQQ